MDQVEPEVLETQQDGDECRLRLRIPPDLDYFAGHFTDAPVLPGVVQLHWAVKQAEVFFGLAIEPHQVSQLKFKQLVLPEMTVSLQLTYQRDKSQIRFQYSSPQGDNSSGIIKV